ncbi:MAG: DUF1997 domain-containing protein [Gloeomargarita sp. SKYG116]|nr:DUF1997 domain-containing protein [Gloeomargarita sp. SKYG116]MDW8400072.1 DUF1997 domain-containing protein [Gloeomargarita sp. SKYGB_i_bin116]
MLVHFQAQESVTIPVPRQPIPIEHYLRQPQRLVYAIADPRQVEELEEQIYRLKMRPRNFFSFTIQPVVDVRVWTEPSNILRLQSVGCEIRGVPYIDRRFRLNLTGTLQAVRSSRCSSLVGHANLQVDVDVPPPLNLMPKPMVEAAGNSLLASVLGLIKQQLTRQLMADYQQWVASTMQAEAEAHGTLAWET